MRSVPGVGKVLARTMLSSLPELGQLDRWRIAALVGVAPLNCDSGKYRGKRRIWGGRSEVRTALYMTTFAATRHNAVIRAYYQHLLDEKKSFKVAMVACMRKLLTILNAMVKSQQLEVVLQSKAFSGSPDRTYLHESVLRPLDYTLIAFFILFFFVALYLLIALGVVFFGVLF